MLPRQLTYTFENLNISTLTYLTILKHSSSLVSTDEKGFFDLQPEKIELNYIEIPVYLTRMDFVTVTVRQEKDAIKLDCNCNAPIKNLCEHQVQVLLNLTERQTLRVFFDDDLRHNKMVTFAKDYGLENEKNLDEYFWLEYNPYKLSIKPKLKELIAVNQVSNTLLSNSLLPQSTLPNIPFTLLGENQKMVIVLGKHRYYDHLIVELYEAQSTKDGKIKNPLKTINPLDFIWKTAEIEEVKFYTSILKFQQPNHEKSSKTLFEGLKALARNPLNLEVFYHDPKISDKVNANSVVPIRLKLLKMDMKMQIDYKDIFHEVSAELLINDRVYDLKALSIKFDYFIQITDTLYLIENPDFLRIITFFKQNNHKILVHRSKFEEFQKNILYKLENRIRVHYSYIRPATPAQIEENTFDVNQQKIIYLSDSEDYILITPVIKYGKVEVPVLSQKQIYASDFNGNVFLLERDNNAEIQFTADLIKQHPDFEDQLDHNYFFLHRRHFLDEDWFLEAFEEWQNQGITILGFNELKENKRNYNKARVTVNVTSGIRWFETELSVRYGKQQVPLKQLQKSLRNRSKYVQLGDGTLGILPAQWIQQFTEYFEAGEIVEHKIRIPKSNFSEIRRMFKEEFLENEVKQELTLYTNKLKDFEKIENVAIPEALNATLRDYQKQGLNWLNFLDEFGFGGCLADDMGLGKTIQIITFILSQRSKKVQNTNLIVVPTSLIFNWEAEVAKFAPSIKILSVYGSNRVKSTKGFEEYEIILTSYGTLLSDVTFLKKYHFNYIFLDESQAIKNPSSQRYQAACLLSARNKIVLTGTPIENNTFDLYGQISFTCPGLLGSLQHFKDHYSMPIDKFKDQKKAKQLQQKVSPFILRRTKKQVAKELPDKTEVVIYCEMGEQQRKVYDAYEKEFREFLNHKIEGDIPKESMHILTGLTKLRQICDSPALLNEEEFYGGESSKIEALMEEIEMKSSEHKILVFSQFVTMLDLIKKELIKRDISFEYLTGQTKKREEKVNEFQENKQVRVFLISLKAGGTGLNLTEADYVYLIDPWWNPAVENQAIDRCYRIGQKKNVVAVRLICPNTIEEKIMRLQASKNDLVGDLIKTDTLMLKSFTKDDLLALVGGKP